MVKNKLWLIIIPIILLAAFLLMRQATRTHPWPESPLYHFAPATGTDLPGDKAAVMQLISGHYAHYNIVSYEDVTTRSPMRTFIISYGFTDLYVENGKLYQKDRFVHAEQILNQKSTTSLFTDKAVQAIKPRVTEIELRFTNGTWHIYRPATPALLGIKGDPDKALPQNRQDTNFTDPDGDGFPGVTVYLDISGYLKGEIYLTRREIYMIHAAIYSKDLVLGHVEDMSEQFIIGASVSFLDRPSNNKQHPDPGMNPVIMKRVDKDIDTWEELKQIRDDLFPPEPAF